MFEGENTTSNDAEQMKNDNQMCVDVYIDLCLKCTIQIIIRIKSSTHYNYR